MLFYGRKRSYFRPSKNKTAHRKQTIYNVTIDSASKHNFMSSKYA